MKHLIFKALLFYAGIGCLAGCNTPRGYRMEGQIDGFAQGTKVSLTRTATHQDEQPEAEAVLKDGHFVLTGEVPEPLLYVLKVEEPRGMTAFYSLMLENTKFTFSARRGDENEMYQNAVGLKDVHVEGLPLQATYHARGKFRSDLDKIYSDMHAKYREVYTKLEDAYKMNDFRTVEEIQGSAEHQAFLREQNDFMNIVDSVIYANIRKNGNSFWGPLLMMSNYSFFPQGEKARAQAVYNGFSEEAKNSFYGKLLKEELFAGSLKGKPLPAINLPDRYDNTRSDAELRQGKKVVLIDFWASWCNPCRKSIPLLKQLYEQYAGQGLEIISISIDRDKNAWTKALDDEQLPWPCLLDTGNVFKSQFHGQGVPTFILVDERGTVVEDDLMAQNLEQKLKELFS